MTIRRFVEEDSGLSDCFLIDWDIDNDFIVTSRWILPDGEIFEFEHCVGSFLDWIEAKRAIINT